MGNGDSAPAKTDLAGLTGRHARRALALRAELGPRIVSDYLGWDRVLSSDRGRTRGAVEWARDHSGDTVCVTLLAGAGSRWVKSVEAARKAFGAGENLRVPDADFPLGAPRGLYPVKNYLSIAGESLPMAAYSISATDGVGKHLVVVRGWEAEIRERIFRPLGVAPGDFEFRTQGEGPYGKVLGHGDAVFQAAEAWRDARYVVTNFGGDANSPLTVLASVLAMKALDKVGAGVDLLLPVAWMKNPVYRIRLDSEGSPLAFGHDKLGGKGGAAKGFSPSVFGYANVGVRVYRAKALGEAIRAMRDQFWNEAEGYSIPGNDPEAHEFALDNVDAYIASRKGARIFGVARPWEITPAKSFDELSAFEKAVKKVRSEWDALVDE